VAPTPDRQSDKDLVVAFKGGEADAYAELYRRYSGRIEHLCFRLLRNPEDAKEATQETFINAYKALGRFNGDYKVSAWLSRIATNVCLDQLRVKTRSTLVPLPDAEIESDDRGPEDVVLGGDLRVGRSMNDIQPLHQKALVLRGLEGMSHEEMAGRLAMTPPQVKALLHRARRSFKRAWGKASGWALGPVVALRSMSGGRSENASEANPQFGGFVSSAGSLVAERVGASALILVAALAGVPVDSTTSVAAGNSPSRHDTVQMRTHLTPVRSAAAKRRDNRSAQVSEAAASSARSVLGGDASATQTLAMMLGAQRRYVAHRHNSSHGKQGLVPSALEHGPGAVVGRQVEKVVKKLPPNL
jgi:RNA polymerase sigma-70 factor (ECF subfamily)